MNLSDEQLERWAAEIWRRVPNYSGYEVSNFGRVRSWRHKNGFRKRPIILKQNNTGRYYMVQLWINNICYPKGVHSLVLTAFVGPCPPNMEACHNDGNGFNNCVSNLRWDTRQNNNLDKHKHGTMQKKIPNHTRKLSDNDIRSIRKLYENGKSHREIARLYNLRSHSSVGRITRGEGWENVT